MDRNDTRATDAYVDRPNRAVRPGEIPALTPMSSHLLNSEEMATKLFAVLEDIHDRIGTGEGREPQPQGDAARVDPLLVMGGNLSRRLQDCLLSAEKIRSSLGG